MLILLLDNGEGVNGEGTLLGKWDAWEIGAEKKCSDFIKKAGYRIISVKITLMGNKIVRVR